MQAFGYCNRGRAPNPNLGGASAAFSRNAAQAARQAVPQPQFAQAPAARAMPATVTQSMAPAPMAPSPAYRQAMPQAPARTCAQITPVQAPQRPLPPQGAPVQPMPPQMPAGQAPGIAQPVPGQASPGIGAPQFGFGIPGAQNPAPAAQRRRKNQFLLRKFKEFDAQDPAVFGQIRAGMAQDCKDQRRRYSCCRWGGVFFLRFPYDPSQAFADYIRDSYGAEFYKGRPMRITDQAGQIRDSFAARMWTVEEAKMQAVWNDMIKASSPSWLRLPDGTSYAFPKRQAYGGR